MNHQHRQYLQLMGVDLYTPRNRLSSIADLPMLGAETEIQAEAPEVEAAVTLQILASREETAPEPVANTEQIEQVDPVPEAKADLEAPDSLVVKTETRKADSTQKPLHFLWQQSGNLLLLSAEEDIPSAPAIQLLKAICSALQRPHPVQTGSGNWPLIDAKPSSETEAQEFLRSFVQGRAERQGNNIILVLFGKTTQKLFPEVAGDFDDMLGCKVPATGTIEEFRVVPSLAEMLEKVYLKSLTWQSIKDLSGN